MVDIKRKGEMKMLHTQEEIKKVYSFVGSNNSWDLTYNEEFAKQDSTYSLATVEDLHDFIAMASYIFEGKVETVDGVVQWYTETTIDEHGFEDYIGEYRPVN